MRGFQESIDFQKAILRVINLDKNKMKGSWKYCNPFYLFWLKLKEDVEVFFAIVKFCFARWRYECNQTEDNFDKLQEAKEHLLSEVADSGAFGMMIADSCGVLNTDE